MRLVRQDALAFLRALPDDYADLVITSPPYNQCRDTKSYGLRARRRNDGWLTKWREQGYVDDMPEGRYRRWLRTIVSECLRVSRNMVVVNHKVRGMNTCSCHPMTLFHSFRRYFWREVIWDRMGSISLNSAGHATSHEGCYAFRVGRGHWKQSEARKLTVWHIRDDEEREEREQGDVWQLSPARTVEHVCPWPLEIPLRFIRAYCPPGGMVVDPFAGRGTAAWAAIHLRRRFAGSEFVPETFDRACRLTQAEYERTEPEMFAESHQLRLAAR